MLVQWCEFLIDICRDQVEFMTQLLQPQTLKMRLEALVRVRTAEREAYRTELIQPLLHVLATGPVLEQPGNRAMPAPAADKPMTRRRRAALCKLNMCAPFT